MDDDLEPYVPRFTDPASTVTEYRVCYRDPATGGEYMALADRGTVNARRRELTDAGYQVAVFSRSITTTAWEPEVAA